MIDYILPAIESYYHNVPDIEFDTIIWLLHNLSSEQDKNKIKDWMTARNRCINCGKQLLTTYVVDRTVSPPVKKPFDFCPNCYI